MTLPAKAPRAYQKLIGDVTRLYQNAREALSGFYWQTGRGIVEVEQDGAVRARYGDQLLETLSRDLTNALGSGFSVRNLRRMRKAYLLSQKRPTSAELAWSQQVELLAVRNARLRARLEKKAVREGLTSRQIRLLARKERFHARPQKLTASSQRKSLLPIKGKPGVYKIVEIGGRLHWDRGFAAYRVLSAWQSKALKAGDFVTCKNGGELEKYPGGTASDLYTYESDLIRVIDADTFWMCIWTARPEWRNEKLRLRGIDAPELSTPEGQAAKRYVDALFRKAASVTVTTTKPDKYHRYLSDVFLKMPGGAEIFLNGDLLENGYAVPMGRVSAGEWEKE